MQFYRYFVSQSSEFCRHNTLCYFSTSVYCLFRYRLSPKTRILVNNHPGCVRHNTDAETPQLRFFSCRWDSVRDIRAVTENHERSREVKPK